MGYPFELGKIYKFNTTSPQFLGQRIEYAKLIGIVDAETARTRFSAIDQLWNSIYPTLIPGTPNDPNLCTFYIFKGLSASQQGLEGREYVLAHLWINDSTVEVIEHVTIKVLLENSELSKVDVIKNALTAAGIQNFYISLL
jgi:hypothetical protein